MDKMVTDDTENRFEMTQCLLWNWFFLSSLYFLKKYRVFMMSLKLIHNFYLFWLRNTNNSIEISDFNSSFIPALHNNGIK